MLDGWCGDGAWWVGWFTKWVGGLGRGGCVSPLFFLSWLLFSFLFPFLCFPLLFTTHDRDTFLLLLLTISPWLDTSFLWSSLHTADTVLGFGYRLHVMVVTYLPIKLPLIALHALGRLQELSEI